MRLSDDQLERYARHIVLKEVGGFGQRALLEAHVAVVGAGGIGSPVIQYLAAAGVGRLTIIDDDVVALSNLQRQVLFTTRDVGSTKVAMAANAVARLNRDVHVHACDRRLEPANARDVLAGADVVVDGSDSFATRLAVSDAATDLQATLVSAAVGQFEGQLGVWRGWEPDQPCYRCLVGDAPDHEEGTCAEAGVIGPLTGILGSFAASEAIRAITGFGGSPSLGRLLLVDALAFRFRTLLVPRDPACPHHSS